MKKVIFSSLVLFMLFSANAFGASYGGGTGTVEDPYQIYDANQLNTIGLHLEDWDKCFILMNDIDLSGFTGDEFNIIGVDIDRCFRGKFDGQGYVIRNFTYISPDSNNVGLFTYFGDDSGDYPELKNLGLENVNIQGNDRVGALIGNENEFIRLSNCYSSGSVRGHNYVGGLVGDNEEPAINCYSSCDVVGNYEVGGLMGFSDSRLENCSSSGSVSGQSDVGGLVGYMNDTFLYDCFSTSSVTGGSWVGGLVGRTDDDCYLTNCYSSGSVSASDLNAGGLVGECWASELVNCYSESDVNGALGVNSVGGLVGLTASSDYDNCYSSGEVSGYARVGGLIGYAKFVEVTVTNCYSLSNVNAIQDVGGLIGLLEGTDVLNSYSVGDVTGFSNVGGFVGKNSDGYLRNCFWDVQASGRSIGVGSGSLVGVMGKSTFEMRKESTFAGVGWDFINVWGIGEGQTYPCLRKYNAADVNHDDVVDFFDFAILAENWLK